MSSSRLTAAVAAALALSAAAPAAALELTEYGPRLGFSVDPDQITFGGYGDWGELGPQVHLRTNADLGLGDNVFTFTLNGDVTYHFENVQASVVPYAGGGLGFAYYDVDVNAPVGVNVDTTFNELGLNLVAGIEMDLGGYKKGSLELRIGIDDIPDLKITAALGFF